MKNYISECRNFEIWSRLRYFSKILFRLFKLRPVNQLKGKKQQ